jgi:biotin transporter BioY
MSVLQKPLYRSLAIALGLLSIPLFGTILSDEVFWGPFDFLIAFGLLMFLIGGIDLSIRKTKSSTSRLLIIFAIIAVFVVVWAELAVGVFGTPFAGS